MGYGQKFVQVTLFTLLMPVLLGWGMETVGASAAQKPCVWCHNHAIQNWGGSNHQQFKCSSCHVDPDWLGMLGKKLIGTRDQIPAKVDNGVCLSCHSLRRKETPPGELVVPHDLHDKKTVECLDCHQNPGHTPRKTNTNATVAMNKCFDCHNGSLATNQCEACHRVITTEPSHALSNWKIRHGEDALENFTCQKCHNSTTEELVYQRQLSTNFEKAQHLSLNTRLCLECHKQRPTTHGSDFLWNHGQQTNIQNSCFICHPRPGEKVVQSLPAKTDCNQCHQPQQHSIDWRGQHKYQVAEEGSFNCYQCHAPQGCGNCHLNQR